MGGGAWRAAPRELRVGDGAGRPREEDARVQGCPRKVRSAHELYLAAGSGGFWLHETRPGTAGVGGGLGFLRPGRALPQRLTTQSSRRPCTRTQKTGGPSKLSSQPSTAALRSACSPLHPISILARPTAPLNFCASFRPARFQPLRVMTASVFLRAMPSPTTVICSGHGLERVVRRVSPRGTHGSGPPPPCLQ